MGKFSLYLKILSPYLTKLLVLFVLPLFLFLKFSPYPLPYIEYFVLITLFLSQFIFYDQKRVRKRLTPWVTEMLTEELGGKVPAQKLINERLNLIRDTRFIVIFFIAILILIIAFF